MVILFENTCQIRRIVLEICIGDNYEEVDEFDLIIFDEVDSRPRKTQIRAIPLSGRPNVWKPKQRVPWVGGYTWSNFGKRLSFEPERLLKLGTRKKPEAFSG